MGRRDRAKSVLSSSTRGRSIDSLLSLFIIQHGRCKYTSVSLNCCLTEPTETDDDIQDAEIQEVKTVLEDYFQLHFSMEEAWNRWTTSKKKAKIITHFKDSCLRFRGLRTLRIDPVECLVLSNICSWVQHRLMLSFFGTKFSFICSQNNNIARITQMVNALCSRYGDKIGEAIVHNGQEVRVLFRCLMKTFI